MQTPVYETSENVPSTTFAVLEPVKMLTNPTESVRQTFLSGGGKGRELRSARIPRYPRCENSGAGNLGAFLRVRMSLFTAGTRCVGNYPLSSCGDNSTRYNTRAPLRF